MKSVPCAVLRILLSTLLSMHALVSFPYFHPFSCPCSCLNSCPASAPLSILLSLLPSSLMSSLLSMLLSSLLSMLTSSDHSPVRALILSPILQTPYNIDVIDMEEPRQPDSNHDHDHDDDVVLVEREEEAAFVPALTTLCLGFVINTITARHHHARMNDRERSKDEEQPQTNERAWNEAQSEEETEEEEVDQEGEAPEDGRKPLYSFHLLPNDLRERLWDLLVNARVMNLATMDCFYSPTTTTFNYAQLKPFIKRQPSGPNDPFAIVALSELVELVARKCFNLSILDVSGCKELEDRHLMRLVKRCKRLTAVYLNGCDNVTDHSVSLLANCSKLQRLELNGCVNLTDKSLVQIIARCPLSYLSVANCWQLDDKLLRQLSKTTTRLVFLNVASLKLANVISSNVNGQTWKDLQSVNINQCAVTNTSIVQLCKLPSLKCLEASECCGIAPFELARLILSSCSTLNTLVFSRYEIRMQVLDMLVLCPTLQKLVMEECTFTLEDDKPLPKATRNKKQNRQAKFDKAKKQAKDKKLAALSHKTHPALQYLSLMGFRTDYQLSLEAMLDRIKHLFPALSHLNIANTRQDWALGSRFDQVIEILPQLKAVGVDLETMKALTDITHPAALPLEKLVARFHRGSNLNDSNDFAAFFAVFPNLKELVLHNATTSELIGLFEKESLLSSTLRILRLQQLYPNRKSAQFITTFLRFLRHSKLEVLDLSTTAQEGFALADLAEPKISDFRRDNGRKRFGLRSSGALLVGELLGASVPRTLQRLELRGWHLHPSPQSQHSDASPECVSDVLRGLQRANRLSSVQVVHETFENHDHPRQPTFRHNHNRSNGGVLLPEWESNGGMLFDV